MDNIPDTPMADKGRELTIIPDSQDDEPSPNGSRSPQVQLGDSLDIKFESSESDASSILIPRPGIGRPKPATEMIKPKKVVKLEEVEPHPSKRNPRQQPARAQLPARPRQDTSYPEKPKRPRPVGMMAYRSETASKKNLVLHGEDGESDVYFDSDGEELEGDTIVVDVPSKMERGRRSVAHRESALWDL